jgi:spore maturation protein CgeB
MNYYNDNEKEREKIAYNGYRKVINNFTQKQVVDKLIDKYNKFKEL